MAFADDPLCVNTPLNLLPVIDSDIATDQGWANANQYAFSNGTTQPDATVQMMRNASNFYFSFDINNDPEFNEEDVIILLLGPSATNAAEDRRIHIHPVSNSGNPANSPPDHVHVWVNSTDWHTRVQNPDAIDPAWIQVRVTAAPVGAASYSYRVEASIATGSNGINLPSTATQLKLHFNVLRFYKLGGPMRVAGQLNWPTNAIVPGVPSNPTTGQLFQNPPRANWGDAILANITTGVSPCQGVRVKSTWINTPGNSTLSVPPVGGSVTNNYFVQIENAGSAPAGNVLAAIHAWRFGISGKFAPVPTMPNPLSSYSTSTPGPLAPGAVQVLGPAAWNISRTTYENEFKSNKIVCSLIQLDVDNSHPVTGVTRTLIGNRYFYWNTYFGAGSVFAHSAVLDTRGFKPPANGDTLQRFDLLVSTREIPNRPERPDVRRDSLRPDVRRDSLRPVVGRDSIPRAFSDSTPYMEIAQIGGMPFYEKGARFFAQSVCGLRRTGTYINVAGTPAELMERTPCYGYWIYHLGAFRAWNADFKAAGLKKIAGTGTLYSITVPVDTFVDLSTRIEAVESWFPGPWPWWVWLLIAIILLALLALVKRRRRA
jgi:hypothetical protein